MLFPKTDETNKLATLGTKNISLLQIIRKEDVRLDIELLPHHIVWLDTIVIVEKIESSLEKWVLQDG